MTGYRVRSKHGFDAPWTWVHGKVNKGHVFHRPKEAVEFFLIQEIPTMFRDDVDLMEHLGVPYSDDLSAVLHARGKRWVQENSHRYPDTVSGAMDMLEDSVPEVLQNGKLWPYVMGDDLKSASDYGFFLDVVPGVQDYEFVDS